VRTKAGEFFWKWLIKAEIEVRILLFIRKLVFADPLIRE